MCESLLCCGRGIAVICIKQQVLSRMQPMAETLGITRGIHPAIGCQGSLATRETIKLCLVLKVCVSSIEVLEHVEDKMHLILLKGFKWSFIACACLPRGNFYTFTFSFVKTY